MLACVRGHSEVAQELIRGGANVNTQANVRIHVCKCIRVIPLCDHEEVEPML